MCFDDPTDGPTGGRRTLDDRKQPAKEVKTQSIDGVLKRATQIEDVGFQIDKIMGSNDVYTALAVIDSLVGTDIPIEPFYLRLAEGISERLADISSRKDRKQYSDLIETLEEIRDECLDNCRDYKPGLRV